MAKNSIAFILILLLCGYPDRIGSQTCIESVYTKELGVKELTGNNDGARVEEYLKVTGLGKGYSWCAAFVKWCLMQCGVVTSITAWSPTAENRNNIVWKRNGFAQQPKSGDVFCLWSVKKGRIAHTGFFHRDLNGVAYETVEGNAADPNSGKDSFNGVGVFKRKRSYHSTYSISRWN